MKRLILALFALGLMGQAPPPVPALPDTPRLTSYSISASTCACAVNFAIYGDGTDFQSWVEVWLNGVRVNYNDPSLGWTITSPTGSLASIPRPITDAVLTFNAAQTGTVQIVGDRRPRRTTQFPENRGVAARDLNQAFTDIVASNRETWDRTNDVNGRAILSPPGNAIGVLPPPATCANKIVGFDSSGLNPTCLQPNVQNITIGNHLLFANDFGAVCDRSTPDQVAFQNTVNQAINNNVDMSWVGGCQLNTGLTVTMFNGSGLHIYGTGNAALQFPNTVTAFNVSGQGIFHAHDFYMGFTGACSGVSSIGFKISTPYNIPPRLSRINIDCPNIGIQSFGISNATTDNISMSRVGLYGYDFEHDGSGNFSDNWRVLHNTLTPDGVATNNEGVHCASCAGLQFLNNDLNGLAARGWHYGIHLAVADSDGDLYIDNNLFEGFTNPSDTGATCIYIERQTTGINFGNINIHGNGFDACYNGIIVAVDTHPGGGQWINTVTIVGNNFPLIVSTTAIVLNNITGIMVANNNIQGTVVNTKTLNIGATVVLGVAGPNNCFQNISGSYSGCAASVNSGTNVTTIAPF